MYYERVFAALSDARVKYLVVGGMAVNLYGVPRMTADLDILVDMSEDNLLKLARAMSSLGYRPRVPVRAEDFADKAKRNEWVREKNMQVFSFISSNVPYESVDILISSPVVYEDAVVRGVMFNAAGIEIPVISIDDLIKMKRSTGRKQDLSDIEMLLKVKAMKGNEPRAGS